MRRIFLCSQYPRSYGTPGITQKWPLGLVPGKEPKSKIRVFWDQVRQQVQAQGPRLASEWWNSEMCRTRQKVIPVATNCLSSTQVPGPLRAVSDLVLEAKLLEDAKQSLQLAPSLAPLNFTQVSSGEGNFSGFLIICYREELHEHGNASNKLPFPGACYGLDADWGFIKRRGSFYCCKLELWD